MDDSTVELQDLRSFAEKLALVLRRQARRPFVLEITGTPKAGKTTLIRLVEEFLRDCGWRVHVQKERAGECPLPMKGHFFFNTWTTGTMLAGLLDSVDRNTDLVVLDRGLFDALVWLERQRSRGQVTENEFAAFQNFVLVERWTRLIDLVGILEVDPAISLKRESCGRLLPRQGSVMNDGALRSFNTSLNKARHAYSERFCFEQIPNSTTAEDGATAVLRAILPSIEAWSDPAIAVVERCFASEKLSHEHVRWSPEFASELLSAVTFEKRSAVEGDERWVQLLACGVQTRNDQVFLGVRRRRNRDQPGPRENSGCIWRGCHILCPLEGSLTLEHLEAEAKKRLQEDLHLRPGALDGAAEPLGCVWTPRQEEPLHMGLLFRIPVTETVAELLEDKEIRTNGRGYDLHSSFVETGTIRTDGSTNPEYKLESWSRIVLEQKWLP